MGNDLPKMYNFILKEIKKPDYKKLKEEKIEARKYEIPCIIKDKPYDSSYNKAPDIIKTEIASIEQDIIKYNNLLDKIKNEPSNILDYEITGITESIDISGIQDKI